MASLVQPDLDDGAVEDQPDDALTGEIALLPGLPGRAGPLPRPADHVLANLVREQAAQRTAHPTGVHPGEIGLGDQSLGAMAEPLVGRQERALPFALGRPIMQPSAWHRQLQRAKGGDQLAWPAAVAVSLGGLTALVAAAAKRRFELFLQELLDEAADLQAYRLLQRVEPLAAGERRWRCGCG